RRGVVAAALSLPLVAAGCKGIGALGTPPPPLPDVTVVRDAIAGETLMISRYHAVLAAAPALTGSLGPLLDQHREHLARLRARLIEPSAGSQPGHSPSPARSPSPAPPPRARPAPPPPRVPPCGSASRPRRRRCWPSSRPPRPPWLSCSPASRPRRQPTRCCSPRADGLDERHPLPICDRAGRPGDTGT